MAAMRARWRRGDAQAARATGTRAGESGGRPVFGDALRRGGHDNRVLVRLAGLLQDRHCVRCGPLPRGVCQRPLRIVCEERLRRRLGL